MRIVLVHPAGSNWVPGKKDITATANRMAPLGLLSIAACLERAGHEVFVHDGLGPRAVSGMRENVRLILGHDPELVGFSATTSGFLDAWEMATAIKEARPGVVTVFGGVHVSALGKSAAGAVFPYRLSLSGGGGGDPDRTRVGGRSGPDRRPDPEDRGRGDRQRPAGAAARSRRRCRFPPTKSWPGFRGDTICRCSATSGFPAPR